MSSLLLAAFWDPVFLRGNPQAIEADLLDFYRHEQPCFP